MIPTPEERYPFDEAIANMFSNPKYANSYIFYGHILGQCRIHFDTSLPAPAGVNFTIDHFNLYINPTGIPASEEHPEGVEGFDSFPLEERLGILKHEMLHILNGHIARREDRDHKLFNYSTDCAINQLIEKKHLPEWCIFPENFPSSKKVPDGLTAEQYYELIDKNFDDKGNNGSSSSKGAGKTLDDHSKWEDSTGDSEFQDDITKGMIEKAVSATQKSRGDLPSNLSNWLDMFSHKRELNWKQVLRGIVGNKRVGARKTLMRRDRRLPNFEWIKGRTKDRAFDLLVVSDVSGSVSDDALLHLWGEVRHICDVTNTAVDLIQVDSRPMAPEKLARNTKAIERKACGGTILHPALEMAHKHNLKFDAVVVTTDGWLDESDVQKFQELNKRVIWLVEAGGQIMSGMSEGRMQVFQLKES